MICWSCEREAGHAATSGAFCESCGAIQPAVPGADHFAVFGIAPAFELDLADLEGRHKELSKKLHPDRFATADARARKAALGRTVQLNDAYRALRDPMRRAEYLLRRSGIELASEEGTRKNGEKVPVPPALLAEILELRMALGEAQAAGNAEEVKALTAAVEAKAAKAWGVVRAGFAESGNPAALGSVTEELVALRYYQRFLEEARGHA